MNLGRKYQYQLDKTRLDFSHDARIAKQEGSYIGMNDRLEVIGGQLSRIKKRAGALLLYPAVFLLFSVLNRRDTRPPFKRTVERAGFREPCQINDFFNGFISANQ